MYLDDGLGFVATDKEAPDLLEVVHHDMLGLGFLNCGKYESLETH